MRFKYGQRFDGFLVCIAALSAFLNVFGIWSQEANTYYTTAVTSMLQSWHNFFYASLDPVGFITIDKPPVTFWVQTLFARVLGMHNWSVILPQALAGIGSVLLIYCLVKPTFGKGAARLASLTMACTPIAVAVSRSNNIDSMLVFTLLLATWMLFKAVNGGRAWWAIGAFAMIGLGFNMKMFEAYMVAPAFYLFYLLAFRGDWKRKLGILAAATAAMLVLTASWATIVDAVPVANRPYIGGSGTNSVLALAFGYNGIQRLDGMGGPGGGQGGGPGGGNRVNNRWSGNRNGAGTATDGAGKATAGTSVKSPNSYFTNQTGQAPVRNTSGAQIFANAGGDGQGPAPGFNDGGPRGQTPPSGSGFGGGGFGGGSSGGVFDTGYPGPLRLFQSSLSDQISWMLPFVGFACIALLVERRRKRVSSESSLQAGGRQTETGWFGGRVKALKSFLTGERTETLFWLGWLLPGMVFFSVAGFYHQYYLIMLAPPIAALTGAGWARLWTQFREREGWTMYLLPSALLGTMMFQLYILKPYLKQVGSGWSIGIAAAIAAIVLALVLPIVIKQAKLSSTKMALALATAGMLVLLAAPAYWATTPLLYGVNSVMPAAGPGSRTAFGGSNRGGGNGSISTPNEALIDYVTKHNTGEPCLFATTDTGTAESYILAGKSVIALGGFNGGDNTIVKLKQMVKDKKIKFFLISSGGFGGGGGSSDVSNWIKTNCTVVPDKEWQSGSTGDGQMGGTLYEVKE